jgi:hypothetical protein
MATWSEALPADSDLLISGIPESIRSTRVAIETLFEREHISPSGTIGSSMAGGYHTKGSARPYYGIAVPAGRTDASAFETSDLGSIFVHTDDTVVNTIYILTAISPTTWTPISTALMTTLLAADRTFLEKLKSTKDFSVGSNTMTVAAASGNTTIAGTLVNTGKITANGGITLKSDDSQLIEHVKNPVGAQDAATKKYVDDAAGKRTTDSFGFPGSGTLIIKAGKDTTHTGNHTGGYLKATVTFDVPFNTLLSVVCQVTEEYERADIMISVDSVSVNGFSYSLVEAVNNTQNMSGVYRIAIGY